LSDGRLTTLSARLTDSDDDESVESLDIALDVVAGPSQVIIDEKVGNKGFFFVKKPKKGRAKE